MVWYIGVLKDAHATKETSQNSSLHWFASYKILYRKMSSLLRSITMDNG
jgi:hypothetical protein